MNVASNHERAPACAFRPRGALLLGLCLALGCEGVLGIQDLREAPRVTMALGGSGGAAGAAAGASGSAGSDASGATGGTAGAADMGVVAVSDEEAPLAPAPGLDAGAPDAAEPGGGILVSGRVIDFLRRPVPDAPVTIGTTTVATDANGAFTIPDVEPPYTASLVVNMLRNGGQARYGYVYEGLTRADPTLQVYAALPEREATSLTVSFENVTFDTGVFAIVAFSSADGRFVDEEATNNTEYLGVPSWSGPPAIEGNLHALLAFRESSFDPPTSFLAHQSTPLGATDNVRALATLDLASTPLAIATLAGSVMGGVFDPRSNYIGLRFADGTALPILDESAEGPEFSYLVPALDDATCFVGAADGTSSFPPYGVAHRENIPCDATDVALAVPRPVTLISPQDGTAVTPSTPYAWSTLSQTAQTFLWHLEFDATFEGMFVLTSRTQIELPRFADGFTVPPGVSVTWSVETHGDAPDVDTLTGPDGYLDAYSLGSAYPIGPNRADGYYTESERRGFVMGSE